MSISTARALFPGFIDSHSHSIDGGLSLIGADATDKVSSIDQLPAFVDDAKKSGRGMRGDILEIQGLPLEFWSHPDVLNRDFSTGAYANQPVLLRGMDGHTAWANHALLNRAGITPEFLKKLTPDERAYYGVDKNMQPNGFLVDAGTAKDRTAPAQAHSREIARRRTRRPRNTTTASASPPGSIL